MTANERLTRIHAKITRAKEHVRDFDLRLNAFYETKPYHVAIEENAQASERIYYLAKVEPVPPAITTVAADILQNLRTPLDRIARALVEDGLSGAQPDWGVYFPIAPSAADYPALRNGRIKSVRQEVVDAIDATEPYKGGKGHALWQLNELNRTDKHIDDLFRTEPVQDGIDLVDVFRDRTKLPERFLSVMRNAGPFWLRPAKAPPIKAGDVLRRESIDKKVDEHRHFPIVITLHAPGVVEREPAIKVLHDMTNLVEGVVSALGKFLKA